MNRMCLLLAVIIICLTSLSLADEEKGHVCFRTVDSDKDGKVTLQEFEKYFKDDLERFKTIDLNKDGVLTHDEYHEPVGHGS